MTRLALATYRLVRVLRVGKVVSEVVIAVRGVIAGSGLATTEMRVAMVRTEDRAVAMCPANAFTLFVDDLGIEHIRVPKRFARQPSKAMLLIYGGGHGGVKEKGSRLCHFLGSRASLAGQIEKIRSEVG